MVCCLLTATHNDMRPLLHRRYFEAESEAEVEAFLRIASKMGQRLRVAGGGLSPNGLALGAEGVLGTQRMDRVLRVDRDKMTVRGQQRGAGRVWLKVHVRGPVCERRTTAAAQPHAPRLSACPPAGDGAGGGACA